MIRKFLATAALVISGFGAVAVQANPSHYECQKQIIGCYTAYTGPVNVAAADLYVKDAEAAMKWVLDTYPRAESVHFWPSRGELVVQSAEGRSISNYELMEIGNHLTDKHLWVETLRGLDHSMRVTRASYRSLREAGGRSRFSQLSKQPVSAQTAGASLELRRAFNPIQQDQFGNASYTRH